MHFVQDICLKSLNMIPCTDTECRTIQRVAKGWSLISMPEKLIIWGKLAVELSSRFEILILMCLLLCNFLFYF